MEIRDLQWRDFDDVRSSYYLCYEEREEGKPVGILLFRDRPSLEQEVEWFSNLYQKTQSGETIALVAHDGERTVGLCILAIAGLGRDSETDHVGELGILIHRDFRGQGVGRRLMEAAIGRGRSRFESIELKVFTTNAAARKLYLDLGFKSCGITPRVVKRGNEYIDVETMILDVGARSKSS